MAWRQGGMRGLALMASVAWATEGPLRFDKTLHDFGKIASNRPVTCQFQLKNRGAHRVVIRALHPACGCLTASAAPLTLPPGGSSTVTLVLHPKEWVGARASSVRLDFEADPSSGYPLAAVLKCRAEVSRAIVPSTTRLFFDDVPLGATRTAHILLQSGTETPVRVIAVRRRKAPQLQSDWREAGKDVWVDVTFDGSAVPPGERSGNHTLYIVTDSPQMPILPIGVTWNHPPLVVAQPARIALCGPAGKGLKASFLLSHVQGKPFRVLSAKATPWTDLDAKTTDDNAVSLVRVEGLGGGAACQQRLSLSVPEGMKAGTYQALLHLTLDEPSQTSVFVRVGWVLQ